MPSTSGAQRYIYRLFGGAVNLPMAALRTERLTGHLRRVGWIALVMCIMMYAYLDYGSDERSRGEGGERADDGYGAGSTAGGSIVRPAARSGSLMIKYTVLINTFRRNELLKQTVAHYAECGSVDSIRVVWSEPEEPSDDLMRELERLTRERGGVDGATDKSHVALRIDRHKEDSMNNRFIPLPGVKTEAIFSVDDDVLVPCTAMDLAFEAWAAAPRSMVGFVPRSHRRIDGSSKGSRSGSNSDAGPKSRPGKATGGGGGTGEYVYTGWWSVWWTGSYSIVLTKAAFLHHDYFGMYTKDLPAALRGYIHEGRNCEDIAMSFLAANATKAPPLWVQTTIKEIGSFGISSAAGHDAARSQCVTRFAHFFGGMPLVEGHLKVVDARDSWLW